MESLSPRPSKQAACLVCRRGKIKCDILPDQTRCRRCIQLDTECIRPDFHAGRQRGIKNKRVGLDKAFYQVQQAVKRARTTEQPTSEDQDVLSRMRSILNDVNGLDVSPGQESRYNGGDGDGSGSDDEDASAADQSSLAEFPPRNAESLAVDDAENPLQLLARASYFRPSEQPRSRPSPQKTRHDATPSDGPSVSSLHEFFSNARVDLDVGEDVDPVSLGLVGAEEADELFTFFHAHLAHTRWGMDPRLFNCTFTRSRSAFLTTSILAASALFMPTGGALSKRLSNHVKALANRVIARRHRSIEIVLAFMVNIPWIFPGNRSTDDETCTYISMATTIAIDLMLHKVLVPNNTLEQGSNLSLSRGECLDPRTALDIDGFPDVDPSSEQGGLLLRSRERCWISLWVVERGMCLARGRPFIVPTTRLIKECESWYRANTSHAPDGHVVSMAVMRRNLDGLFNTVRGLCDGSQNAGSDGSLVAHSIQTAIERFFDQWYQEWGVLIGSGPERRLPPYVEILVTHTRLSAYGGVINHPTAPVEVRRFFRTAGVSSALNVMRVAIQGESQLRSMPNNTAIMISFAACFALTLSAYATDGSALAPSVRKLIIETAGVLERIGTITKHRNGLSVLYGRYLRQIVKKAATGTATKRVQAREAGSSSVSPAAMRTPLTNAATPQYQRTPQAGHVDQSMLWPETLQFSSMSDDQIAQVLNQPANEFTPSFGGLSWEDMNNFDWLHWPEFGMQNI